MTNGKWTWNIHFPFTIPCVLVSDFDYDLPEELIAQEAAPRGASRLMVLDRASSGVQHTTIASLPSLLRAGDLVVVNNTRVFAARLLGHRVPSGGAVECLLLGDLSCSPAPQPPSSPAPEPPTSQIWSALMHPGQKLKPGALVRFEGPAGVLVAEVLERHYHGRRTIRLWVEHVRSGVEPTAHAPAERSGASRGAGGPDDPGIDALVDALGHVPLPPYIKRQDTAADRERYQTIFARSRGSVAAPTAGLHFTPGLVAQLADRGVEFAEVTLHVGYGTFKPVRADVVEEHVVDPEAYEVVDAAAAAIQRASAEGRRIVAVGTTTTRAIEDAAIRGGGRVTAGRSTASIFINPGFRFQVVGALLTNFHLPRSSLLMLVAAFAGRERVLAAYREAVAARYRFYSYGDAMLVV
jgi:S-adenosylmethionine:tRNA ribosyltransferase-isomerase